MTHKYAEEIRRLVTDAAASNGIVNVPAIAGQIHLQDPAQSLFEIEHLVLAFAELSGVPIVFDQPRAPLAYTNGLMLEFVTETDDQIVDVAQQPLLRSHPDTSGSG